MYQELQGGSGGSGGSGIPIDIFKAWITTNASQTHSNAFGIDTTGKSTLKIKVDTTVDNPTTANYSPAYYTDTAGAWTNFTNNTELTLNVASESYVWFGFNNNRNQYPASMIILEYSLT